MPSDEHGGQELLLAKCSPLGHVSDKEMEEYLTDKDKRESRRRPDYC